MKAAKKFFLSLGYSSWLVKKGRGTLASLLTLIIIYPLLARQLHCYILALDIFLSYLTIYLMRGEDAAREDPSWIVIDEFLGMSMALALIKSSSLPSLLIIFIIFRCLDIYKPWPIYLFDQMHNAWGIILDDLCAGFLSVIIYYAIYIVFYLF